VGTTTICVEGEEEKIIARERAYHGCTVLAGSLTGLRFYQDNMTCLSLVFAHGSPALLLGCGIGRDRRGVFTEARCRVGRTDFAGRSGDSGCVYWRAGAGYGWDHSSAKGYWQAIQPC